VKILFRSCVLNSVWILILAVESKGLPCYNGYVGALQQGFLWGFILLYGWACITPFCVIEFENLKSSLCLPLVERRRSLNSVLAGISKLCLDSGC
jgi:hypothetical protein